MSKIITAIATKKNVSTERDLLLDYFYVYNSIMSVPCDICKFAFHPEKEKIDNEFCKNNCCFPNLDDFCKIAEYFNIKCDDDSIWNICDKGDDKYIKGYKDEDIKYLTKRVQIVDIKNLNDQREQIAKYFWLYAYIIKGPENRIEFFNLLNCEKFPSFENNYEFQKLVSEFSKLSKLLGRNNFNAINIYSKINSYYELKLNIV